MVSPLAECNIGSSIRPREGGSHFPTVATAAKMTAKSLILFASGPGRTGSHERPRVAITTISYEFCGYRYVTK